MSSGISYLSQEQAQKIDEVLMGPLSFSVDQLMELAGLSVATSVAKEYGSHSYPNILVICGPGNNGGDGLVAARHLKHFGYNPTVWYPKPTQKSLYQNLTAQLKSLKIEVLGKEEVEKEIEGGGKIKDKFQLVLDAIFGFSFSGEPRPPFDKILKALTSADSPPVASVDCPSGWHVEEGPNTGSSITPLNPDMLISLTAPKLGSKYFKGAHHYLGGRFVPPEIFEEFKLQIPAYRGTEQCVRLNEQPEKKVPLENGIKMQDMRVSYERAALNEEDVDENPYVQFERWFKSAVACPEVGEANAMALATCGPDGKPTNRFVLNKGFDGTGFLFFTNYDSRKGMQLEGNPYASLVFYWEPLQRSIRIEGYVEKLSQEASVSYFQSRPRGSQVGAWASKQSHKVNNGRKELDAKYEEIEPKFEGQDVLPIPPNWGGYRVKPTYIEFWQGRKGRLHDRIVYLRNSTEDQKWSQQRLWP